MQIASNINDLRYIAAFHYFWTPPFEVALGGGWRVRPADTEKNLAKKSPASHRAERPLQEGAVATFFFYLGG